VNIWYYVASKDEPDRRSGFAHLFEHLMFMGTRRVPGSDFDTIMESGGGWNNASTSEDRTNYFSFGPSNLLPTLLWLDADRLEDLGREMTLEKLNKQREVVRNERRQTSEMQPYGRAELMVPEIMFPSDHPYHHTVIGSHEDLEAATVDDVKKFFATYYVPANASLVVAGDFKPDEIKPLIAKLFGTLSRGSDPVHHSADPVQLDEVKRFTFTDNVQFARSTLVYHSPARFKPGDAEMDLAADILAEGKSSRLYKRLVYEDKLATTVSAMQSSMYLGSLFYIHVTARPGVSLDRIEAVTDEVLNEFLARGPTPEELARRQTATEVSMVSNLQSLLSKADTLNEYNFFLNEPDSFKTDLDRYRNATVESVRDSSKKVLTPGGRLIMRVIPEIQAAKDKPREARPTLSDASGFQPQAPETFKLSNGTSVHHWKRSDLPLVHVAMLVNGGAGHDHPSESGRAYLTASMLDEGAGELGALAFADALDMLGASFTVNVEQDSTTVGLSVLKRNVAEAFKLYADAILRPRFEEKEWERVKTLHIQALRQAEDEPTQVASRVSLRAFFGEKHPYGRPVNGTVDAVENLKLDSIKTAHTLYFAPQNARLFVAGDLTADEARAALEKAFNGWQPAPNWKAPPPIVTGEPGNKAFRVAVVDKPGSVQTVIRFVMPGPAYNNPDRVPLNLLNIVLGGSFTSRLNQNLREEHGYTYGARSSFAMSPTTGYFSAGASVQAEVTGPSLREFFAELKSIIKGDVSPEETAKAQQTQRTSTIQSFQGLSGLVGTAILLERNGLPFSTIREDLAAIDDVKASRLNELAKEAIPLNDALLLMVGDRKTIEKQIEDLSLPTAVELTVRGDPK
jgi:predicted Zn-dependent peptidase